jgi:hypothetical protein
MNYPKDIKAFYMRQNDDGRTVAAMGVLAPGIGEAGEAAAGRPMGAAERAIIDTFEAVTKRPKLMLEFTLQPGEAYFINNYTILHARTAFDDGDAPEDARRHLLRLWLDAPIRPVHPYIRSRGILPVAGRTPSFDWGSITAVRH